MSDQMLTVLYVDDEVLLLDLGRIFLQRIGNIKVVTALSAKEGLEKLSTGRYEGVISDYQMPGMDGIAFLQEVRKNYGDIPFILFTGRGREEVVIQAFDHGADFYLQKGGEPKSQFVELEHKIRQAVSKKKAEFALRESEKTLRVLLDAIPDGVGLINRDITVVAVNEALASRFQRRAEELTGQNLHNYSPPDLAVQRNQRIEEVIRTKNAVNFEDQREDLTLENGIYPIFDEEGEVYRLAIYSRDITERKRNEQDLMAAYEQIAADEEELREKFDELKQSERQIRESEERFRSLTENSLDTIMLFDRNLRHLYVNPNIELQTGIPAREFIGKTHADLGFPRDLADHWERTIRGVFASGETSRSEFRLQSGIWIDWLVVPVQRDGGEIEQVITSARDITERKNAEEKIRLAEFSVENSGVATLWIDKNSKVIRGNIAACEELGYSPEELIQLSVSDFDPNFPATAWDQLWEKIKVKKHLIMESVHKRKDGNSFPVEISSSLFQYGDQELIFSYSYDISERKRAEEELSAAYEEIAASQDALNDNYQQLLHKELALKQSEQTLSDIINFSPDATFAVDTEDKVIAWNRQIEKMTGIVNQEIIGKPMGDFSLTFYLEKRPYLYNLLDSDIDSIGSYYTNISREGMSLTAETSLPILKGEKRVLWIKASPLYDEEGKIIGAIESMRDITEWKHANDALVESEARFRGLFDQAFHLAAVLDLDGTLVQINQTALQMIGLQKEDVISKMFWETPWWNHSPHEQKQVHDAIIRARAGELVKFQAFHPDKEGNIRIIDFSIKPIRGKEDEVIALLPEGRDITDLKKIESDLIASHTKLRTFFNHTYDAIFIHDHQGRVLEVNNTMCRMYHLTPEEAIQYTIQDYTGPGSSIEEAKDHWNKALSGEDQIFLVQARRPKDGSLFHVEVFLTRIDGDDEPIILANVRRLSDN